MMQTLYTPGLAVVKVYHGAMCKADGCNESIGYPDRTPGSRAPQERDAWATAHEHDDRLIYKYTEVRIITA